MAEVKTHKIGKKWVTDSEYNKYLESLQPEKTYIDLRKEAYGTVEQQIEFITEHGLTAWKSKVSEIKKQYPKPE
jgi:hypothetical protein